MTKNMFKYICKNKVVSSEGQKKFLLQAQW